MQPTRTQTEKRWLLWPPLAFFAIALGIPMAMLLVQSFDRGGGAFVEMFTMSSFTAALLRTLVMAAVVTVLTTLIGAVYGLAIWAAPRWFSGILLAWLMLSLWTSIVVRTVGWMLLEIPRGAIYWLLSSLGLVEEPIELYQTALAMYPAMVAVMLPFVVLPAMTAMSSIDREQLNAAVIFGAGPTLVLRSVILPALMPALISGGVLVFVMSLGFYVTPLLLGGPANLTVSGLINLQVNTLNRPDLGASMSLLLVAATVVIYLIADRLFKVSEKWG
ncbi:ABC transporter permease [Salinibacterium sp. SYSU T00001]|uniref:ABC transporter permease n=1 Tax=Homoserinimonas sedimenticola TaxID=2986805 RepID=UPI00223597C2|nr:ABC transporter permease [Salinibacterium sedimenticola]MCW4385084.1 ABC transporter permease [Salinibacterium sedimenticola]